MGKYTSDLAVAQEIRDVLPWRISLGKTYAIRISHLNLGLSARIRGKSGHRETEYESRCAHFYCSASFENHQTLNRSVSRYTHQVSVSRNAKMGFTAHFASFALLCLASGLTPPQARSLHNTCTQLAADFSQKRRLAYVARVHYRSYGYE